MDRELIDRNPRSLAELFDKDADPKNIGYVVTLAKLHQSISAKAQTKKHLRFGKQK
jgi:hypothetical protein